MNPGIYSQLIPTSTTSLPLSAGAYGFDGGVFYASNFPSEAKLAGFACSSEAIAMAAAAPDLCLRVAFPAGAAGAAALAALFAEGLVINHSGETRHA